MTAPRNLPPALLFVAFGALLLFTELPTRSIGRTSGGLFVGARSVHDSVESFCRAAVDIAASRDAIVLLALAALPLGIVAVTTVWSIVVQIVRLQRLSSVLRATEIPSLPPSLIRAASRAGLRERVRLFESDDFSAFCFGLLSPHAWVSTATLAALDSAELEAVLRHEAWHVQQRDPLNVLFANAGSAAVGFFPLVRRMAQAYLLDRELQADAAVVQQMEDSYPLASALHRAASVAQHPLPAAVGAFNSIDARIDQLTDGSGSRATRAFGFRASTLRLLCSVAPSAAACLIVTTV